MKMNVGEMLLKTGASVLRTVFPPAGVVIDMVNDLLPDDKKLPADATGDQVKSAMDALPPDKRAEILSKEIDVEIEEIRSWTQIVQALAQADASGASTRPRIALMMAWMLVVLLSFFAGSWIIAVGFDKTDVMAQIKDSWEIFAVVLAIPMEVVRRYFGVRTEDKKVRAGAALGQPPVAGGLGGMVGQFLRR